MTGHDQCHETVDPATRDEMLATYNHRCQGCGQRGPTAGGLATLHVHHLTRDPDAIDEHDPENLTVLCRACHSWQHQQTTEADVPIELSDEDVSALLPQDIEMLQILCESGPATTGEITSALSAEFTVTAVRERLWVLAGLDNMVASRDRQLVDQDADTGKWGVVEQIEHSSRGRIPSDPQLLLQRIEDEYVRQALERGCDRDAVMAVLDISRRSTFYKEKRGRAYDFPVDAIRNRSGGRPPADAEGSDTDDVTEPEELSAGTVNTQQRLDTVTDGRGQDDAKTRAASEQGTSASGNGSGQDASQPASEQAAIQDSIQEAIAALQAVADAL